MYADIPEVQLGEKRLYRFDGSVEKVFKWQEMGISIQRYTTRNRDWKRITCAIRINETLRVIAGRYASQSLAGEYSLLFGKQGSF